MKTLRPAFLWVLLATVVLSAGSYMLSRIVSEPHPSGHTLAMTNTRIVRAFLNQHPDCTVSSFDPSNARITDDGLQYSGGQIIFQKAADKLYYAAQFTVTNRDARQGKWETDNAQFKVYASATSIWDVTEMKGPNPTSEGIRQPADGSPKPSM